MSRQESQESGTVRHATVRVLSLLDAVAAAALLLFIFVLPTYSTSGESVSSQTGVVIQSAGSATIFESNPQAFTVVMGVVALALATVVLTLLIAWLDSLPARWALLVPLVPLTGLTLLAAFSIGIFMAPLVTISWAVFAMRKPPARPMPPERPVWL